MLHSHLKKFVNQLKFWGKVSVKEIQNKRGTDYSYLEGGPKILKTVKCTVLN